MQKVLKYTIIKMVLLCFASAKAQQELSWMNFEQLQDSLDQQPKKTFVYFYADWCVYCKKMERAAFKNDEVVKSLNTDFYAVKMNAESTDTITFDGQEYKNLEVGQKRNPTHEIPLALASRPGMEFTLPAIVLLDENFKILARYFKYLSAAKMQEILKQSE